MSDPLTFQQAAASAAEVMVRSPMIRAVNFHNTPRERAAQFDVQLARLSRDFSPVTEDDLDAYLSTGRWHKRKPGVIISVFEGYRNGFDVMLPLLERHGLVGWFFIITGFITAPPADQLVFAQEHDIGMATREYPDGRYALSWEELRSIRRHHVVASHARTHVSLDTLDTVAREREVLGSQREIEQNLGWPARSFVSYGGPAYGTDPATDGLIDRAGYQFVFSNLRIQRLRSMARR
ncbi:MAG: polysaccharide deacetylase family protein [Verrucomicrobiales bacterium]|nr:polysaccharide deacetylase family protein [Verrucomicrobiales bacterium]